LIAVTRGAVRALADMRIKAVEQRRDERGASFVWKHQCVLQDL
jgi:hypothetical protein